MRRRRFTLGVREPVAVLVAAASLAGCCCQPVTYSVATYAVPYTAAYTYRRSPDSASGATAPVAVVQPMAPYAVVPPTPGCGLGACGSAARP